MDLNINDKILDLTEYKFRKIHSFLEIVLIPILPPFFPIFSFHFVLLLFINLTSAFDNNFIPLYKITFHA